MEVFWESRAGYERYYAKSAAAPRALFCPLILPGPRFIRMFGRFVCRLQICGRERNAPPRGCNAPRPLSASLTTRLTFSCVRYDRHRSSRHYAIFLVARRAEIHGLERSSPTHIREFSRQNPRALRGCGIENGVLTHESR